jgi:hypothetical protein
MLELALTELLATSRHHQLHTVQVKLATEAIRTKTQWEQEAIPGPKAVLELHPRRRAMGGQPSLVSRSHNVNMSQYNNIAQSRKDITLLRGSHSNHKVRSTSYKPKSQVSSGLVERILS